jgi:RNA polymerase sigma-70 factor (ECF subfamily)
VDKQPDLAELFEEHELRVFTYLLRMVADRETAADLTQETFLRALRGAHRFRGDSTVTTWLLGIARRVFLEWIRKKRVPEVTHTSTVAVDPPGDDPVDIERTLVALAAEHREVLVLRFVLDLSGQEVAGILGISHDSVRQRTTRAKRAFRDVWEA